MVFGELYSLAPIAVEVHLYIGKLALRVFNDLRVILVSLSKHSKYSGKQLPALKLVRLVTGAIDPHLIGCKRLVTQGGWVDFCNDSQSCLGALFSGASRHDRGSVPGTC